MKYTLINGIIITDNRNLQCGISIDYSNASCKYMALNYGKNVGFYINITSTLLSINIYTEFYKELDSMRLAMIEANNLIK